MAINAQETPGYDPIGAARDEVWKSIGGIAADLAAERPSVGRKVQVQARGKHYGNEGVVFWHGENRFTPYAHRHENAMSGTLRQAEGKFGYRVGVRCDDGSKFFIDAHKVIVLDRTPTPEELSDLSDEEQEKAELHAGWDATQ